MTNDVFTTIRNHGAKEITCCATCKYVKPGWDVYLFCGLHKATTAGHFRCEKYNMPVNFASKEIYDEKV